MNKYEISTHKNKKYHFVIYFHIITPPFSHKISSFVFNIIILLIDSIIIIIAIIITFTIFPSHNLTISRIENIQNNSRLL